MSTQHPDSASALPISDIVRLIEDAKLKPVDVWPGYDFTRIPFAVYDDNDVVYIDHPNPPATRPNNLMAATSVEINGVHTATIPTYLCTTPELTVPIAYHEGFHVYQQTAFNRIEANMFTAMSYYPEMDADYRALCRLEIEILRRENWSATQKLETLAGLAVKRREIMQHDSLLNYERFLEQNEGTASYVEQNARQQIFGIAPTLNDIGHGWSRFYLVGAAIAWLMDEASPGWTSQIEQGKSFGDMLLASWQGAAVDLNALGFERLQQEEQVTVAQLRQEVEAEIEAIQRDGLLRIRYPTEGKVFRAFSPATMISLGDGRTLHRTFFNLLLPDRGSVVISGPAIDDVANHEIQLASVPVTLEDGTLRAKDGHVEINISGVTNVGEGVYQL